MTERLAISGLRKRYGEQEVLRGVDFNVHDGEIVALLGINGAGKTTTLECIEGIRKADAGTVHIEGSFSAQLQTGALPEFLKGSEILELLARWNGRPLDRARTGLGPVLGKQYRTMSTGQKRRLLLAAALLSDPDLLLLDEPTAGLDVEGRQSMHDQIKALRAEGKAILLSTHDLAEVREICDRIIMLRDGIVAFDGSPEAFADTSGIPATVHIRTRSGTESFPADSVAARLLELLPQYEKRNQEVLDVRVERGTMEEQFLKLSKGA